MSSTPPEPATSNPDRRFRRRRHVLAFALAASTTAGLMGAGPAGAAQEPPARHISAPSVRPCHPLWDQILVLGLPEQTWSSTAAHFDFTQRGEWLSADGLVWEHFDGRVVTVATPRPSSSAVCDAGPRADRAALAFTVPGAVPHPADLQRSVHEPATSEPSP